MINLKLVLALKIFITVTAWCIPLLTFPAQWFVFLGFPAPQPEVFVRLLGTAYSALVVGYVIGYRKEQAGIYPSEAVWVGIASNGGATVVLIVCAFLGAWSAWGPLAQAYMWLSLASVALITVGLVIRGPCNNYSRISTKAS